MSLRISHSIEDLNAAVLELQSLNLEERHSAPARLETGRSVLPSEDERPLSAGTAADTSLPIIFGSPPMAAAKPLAHRSPTASMVYPKAKMADGAAAAALGLPPPPPRAAMKAPQETSKRRAQEELVLEPEEGEAGQRKRRDDREDTFIVRTPRHSPPLVGVAAQEPSPLLLPASAASKRPPKEELKLDSDEERIPCASSKKARQTDPHSEAPHAHRTIMIHPRRRPRQAPNPANPSRHVRFLLEGLGEV